MRKVASVGGGWMVVNGRGMVDVVSHEYGRYRGVVILLVWLMG